jgi:hypothetical protein
VFFESGALRAGEHVLDAFLAKQGHGQALLRHARRAKNRSETCDFIGEKLIVCSKTMHGNAWWRLIVKYSTRLIVLAKRVGREGLGGVLLAGELG